MPTQRKTRGTVFSHLGYKPPPAPSTQNWHRVSDDKSHVRRRRDERLHEELSPLFKALFVETNPIPVKFALHRMGRIRNELRLPLVPLSADHEPAVADALRRAGAI